MEIKAEITYNTNPKELAKALFSCKPQEFCEVWYEIKELLNKDCGKGYKRSLKFNTICEKIEDYGGGVSYFIEELNNRIQYYSTYNEMMKILKDDPKFGSKNDGATAPPQRYVEEMYK